MAKVILIDDEAPILELMSKFLCGLGHEVITCQTGAAGIAAMRENKPELVIVDLHIGDISGLEIIKLCQNEFPNTSVIMVTGHGSVDTAVEAMRLGAFNYLTKPFELSDLKKTISLALAKKSGGGSTSSESNHPHAVKLIGVSSVIQKILTVISRVANSDSPVLLEGEFGAGKNVIARALHEAGRRSAAEFREVQCRALPADGLDTTILDGGTVHIAEINHMPMRVQSQFYNLLNQASGTTCRLITSSTVPLESLIAKGEFREDLYYKISIIPIAVPPLRERREDIAPLVEHFLREHALRSGGMMKRMDSHAAEFIEKYSWPGNISELRNTIERAAILADGPSIQAADLPAKITQRIEVPLHPGQANNAVPRLPIGVTLDEFIKGQEKLFINETLKLNNGSREKTAGMLGVSIATLYRKMDLGTGRRTTS